MGIKYNNNKISMKSTDAQYPYYNGNQVSQVYYNGTLVWKKYTPLDFTFDGNSVTGYTGSATSFTIPSSYSTVTDIDGTVIFIAGSTTSVTAIADGAFEGLSSIISVTIPSSIKTIGQRAFQFCINLTTINMSATPTSIGYCAFALTRISSLSSYMYNCPSIGQGAFASQIAWTLSGTTSTIASKLVNTNLGILSDPTTGRTGIGYIYAAYAVLSVNQSSGENTASATIQTVVYFGGTTIQSLSCSVRGTTTGNTYVVKSYNGWPGASIGSIGISSASSTFDGINGSSVSPSTTSPGSLSRITAYISVRGTCIIKGTLITLADGTQKPIENLTYSDLLLVWNFEKGSYDYQYPLAILKGYTYKIKYKIILEDGDYLEICGQHDIYDPIAHTFRIYGDGAIHQIDKDYYVLKYISKNIYDCIKIASIEIITEDVESYSVITGGTITAFANKIMIGYSTLNYARIQNSNSFEKEFQNDKELCYTYDRFKKEIYNESNKYLILGLNLHYVNYFNKNPIGLPSILAPFNNMIKPKEKNNKFICIIGFLEDNTLIEKQYLEDDLIILPNFKSDKYTKWYVVGEYQEYKPGDTITVNFSTLIRAI